MEVRSVENIQTKAFRNEKIKTKIVSETCKPLIIGLTHAFKCQRMKKWRWGGIEAIFEETLCSVFSKINKRPQMHDILLA